MIPIIQFNPSESQKLTEGLRTLWNEDIDQIASSLDEFKTEELLNLLGEAIEKETSLCYCVDNNRNNIIRRYWIMME
jgi:hypothetical protein